MEAYMKDENGQAASPINGELARREICGIAKLGGFTIMTGSIHVLQVY
jgi:hypothetical protein